MNTDLSRELLTRLSELRTQCPDMRFGQMIATLEILAEDTVGRSWWEIEDEEFLTVLDRFRRDLTRREQGVA